MAREIVRPNHGPGSLFANGGENLVLACGDAWPAAG
jgi:hypothetical protein